MEVAALAVAFVALVVALVALQRVRDATRAMTDEVSGLPTSPPHEEVTEVPPEEKAPAEATRATPRQPGAHVDLRPAGEATYVLTNYGTKPAYGVRIKANRLGGNAFFGEIPPGGEEEYPFKLKDDATRNVVEITWHTRHDQSDPVQRKRLRLTAH